VFRRDALVDEIGMIDEDLPRGYAEDTDVLLAASRLAPVRLVNEPLVRVRWQGQSYFFGRWADYAAALTYLLHKHPQFADDDAAHARMLSQIAFGEVSSGQRRAGRRHARQALALRPTTLRAWLALAVGLRLLTPGAVVTVARRFGKGI
jgi:Flp pilus assembly protein TadD